MARKQIINIFANNGSGQTLSSDILSALTTSLAKGEIAIVANDEDAILVSRDSSDNFVEYPSKKYVNAELEEMNSGITDAINELSDHVDEVASALTNDINELSEHVAQEDEYLRGEIAAVESSLTEDIQNAYTIVKDQDGGDYASVYHLVMSGTNVGDAINIPKDMVIEKALLVNYDGTSSTIEGGIEVKGNHEAGKYIVLIISNTDEDQIWLNVNELIDIYTGDNETIEVNSSNVISVKDGVFLPMGDESDPETAATYNGLKNALINDELTLSQAILTLNASAGFNENGESVLPNGVSLTDAILELSGRTVDLSDYYTKSETDEAIEQAIIDAGAIDSGVVESMINLALDDYYTSAETYTKTETETKIGDALNELISGAPGTLDTLKELADALSGDPQFAVTITQKVDGKLGEVSVNDKILNTGNTAITIDGTDIPNGTDITYSGVTLATSSDTVADTFNSLLKELIEDELAISSAINTMNENAGFNENGESTLGMSLTEAIEELRDLTGKTGDNIINGSPVEYSGTTLAESSDTITDTFNELFKEMLDNEEVVSQALNNLDERVGEKSTVTFVPTQTTGLSIGTLTIDGVDVELYSQEGGTDRQEVEEIVNEALEPYWDSATTEENILSAITDAIGHAEFLPMGEPNDPESAKTYHGVANRINNNERVVAGAMNVLINSIGLTTGGTSPLPNDMTLVDAILEVSGRSVDLSDYYTSAETQAYVQDALSGVDLSNYYTSAQTDELLLDYLPIGTSADTDTDVTYYGLKNAIIEDELVLSKAVIQLNTSAGFSANGESQLPCGATLTEAIQELMATKADVTQFATINGSAITEGGNLVIEGGAGETDIVWDVPYTDGVLSGETILDMYFSGYTLDFSGYTYDDFKDALQSDSIFYIDTLGYKWKVLAQEVDASEQRATGVLYTEYFFPLINQMCWSKINVTYYSNSFHYSDKMPVCAMTSTQEMMSYVNNAIPDMNDYWNSAQTNTAISNSITGKQDTLISGTNIKTINGNSLLGSGNIVIEGGGTGSSIQVENVLTSTSTTNALSAAMGKSLNDTLTAHTSDTTVHVTTSEKNTWSGKQDAINDLSNIRNNAVSGKAAYDSLSAYTLDSELNTAISNAITGKQDTISDINDIRNNAASGKSAYDSLAGKADTATTLAGYGISDAFINGNVIHLGSDEISVSTGGGGEENVITAITVNGTQVQPSNKTVALSVPTSSSIESSGFTKNAPTESSILSSGFTKNIGTITGIQMNGVSKGTSGVVDLGTVLTSFTETQLSTATTGNGNAVTSISVNGHEITYVKDLTFLTGETDPTVPAWAKSANKPTYTASEVGALPTGTTLDNVPDGATRKLSDFVTTGYVDTLLGDYYTSAQTDNLLSDKADVQDLDQNTWGFAYTDASYTKQQSDDRYYTSANTYTKTESDNRYYTSGAADSTFWKRTEQVNSAITAYSSSYATRAMSAYTSDSAETLDNEAAKAYASNEVLKVNLKGANNQNDGQLQVIKSGDTIFQIDEGGQVGVGKFGSGVGLNADLDVNRNALVRGKVAIGYDENDTLFTTGDTQLEINGSAHIHDHLTVRGNLIDEEGVHYAKIVTISQADYNLIQSPDPNTLYIIV